MGANVRLSPRHRILVLDGAHGFQFMPGACHHLTANAFEHWVPHSVWAERRGRQDAGRTKRVQERLIVVLTIR